MSLLEVIPGQHDKPIRNTAQPRPRAVRPPVVYPSPRSGPALYPGIVRDAKALGVTRAHLYAVLAGKRQSRRLLAAYHRLTAKAAA